MDQTILDSAACSNQRLTQDLAATHTLTADVMALATKQVDLESFELKQLQQICQQWTHDRSVHAQSLVHDRTRRRVLQRDLLRGIDVCSDRERGKCSFMKPREDQFLLARV